MVDLETLQGGGGGVGGALARGALRALSWGWATAWHAKEAAYATGLRTSARLPVPVVSVGNLVAGGTGKTPLVAWLTQVLLASGRRPGVLSRGYGPLVPSSGLSDEGAVLRHLLGPDVPLVEDPNRLRGGRQLLGRHPATDVLLLDDGFQHRRLARDLDLVLLDATRPWGHGHLLPRGLLREPPRALARADLVVVTRAERVHDADLASLGSLVKRYTDAAVAVAETEPTAVVLAGTAHPPSWLARRRVFVCCGIGNPRAFLDLLAEDLGAEIVGRRLLPDHGALDEAGWAVVRREARDLGAEAVVTTRKDVVKRLAVEDDLAVLDVGIRMREGEDPLRAALDRL